MSELRGSAAFLQQAHRNNWQHYLASLQPGARRGWELCVLTASDERQAEMYRRQLAWRAEAGLLPVGTRFLVIPDPQGRRIGSGGATLRVLERLASEGALLDEGRTLIIHSGGDSRRLPHCSALGKLFARLPRVLPDGRASTVFDEFLISLSGLAAALPAGVLVASGDVLLLFDHLQLSFLRRGVIGVAAAAPVEMGTHHGVYVTGEDGHRLRAYLHKPSLAEMEHWGAVQDEMVQIDTGLVWLDAPTSQSFRALLAEPVVADTPLNLYGDLLLPLAQSTTLDAYLTDTSDAPATPELQAARRVIWERLRETPFSVEGLQPAAFIHFGTSDEYWQMVAADPELAATCGWVGQAAAFAAHPTAFLALISAAVTGEVVGDGQPALVVDSLLSGQLAWEGAALVANVQTAQPLELAGDIVVHQLPMEHGYVTRIFGLHDDPKLSVGSGTFLNHPWAEWLAEAGMAPELLWPGLPDAERTLWNAQLYPLMADREESLRLSLPLQRPAAAPAGWRDKWQAAERLSLAEGFARANGARILADLAEVEDEVAAQRFFGAVKAEQPAAEAKELLGPRPESIARRGELVAARLAVTDPILRLRGYWAVAEAHGESVWEERAFGALAEMIKGTVLALRSKSGADVPRWPSPGNRVRVETAARVDFGGGWSDTPPYSIERGGTVLNAALTLRGAYPIVAEAEGLEAPKLVLECRDIGAVLEPVYAGEVLAYANPADPFALPKAALVLRGIVPAETPPGQTIRALFQQRGGGVRLCTQTSIPRGSGLGTSSILGGAVLACLARWLGLDLAPSVLFEEVLFLEQMLTTGGGWQDQVGGLTGGIKLVTTRPGLPQQIGIAPVPLSSETEAELSRRLLLVYTGQQRLAKNLLRSVMGRWMARDAEMVWILGEIARLAMAMREALQAGDLDRFGALLGEHWQLNKRMDPGCTNPFIDELFAVMQPYVCGGKLAGAGGGGFAIVVARDAQCAEGAMRVLQARYPRTPVAVWPCAIPRQGMVQEERQSR